MEPESSLPHSQVPATCPYPVPARSSPHPHIPLPFLFQIFREKVTQHRILKFLTTFRRKVTTSSLGWFNFVQLTAVVTARRKVLIRCKDVKNCGETELMKRATEWALKPSYTTDICVPLNRCSSHVNPIQSPWSAILLTSKQRAQYTL